MTANRLTEDDASCYAYDANGNLTPKTAKAGGAVTAYTWDAQDQLTWVTSRTNPVGEFADFTYESRGNLTTATDPKSQLTTNSYDALNRPTQLATVDNTIALGYARTAT